MVSGDRWDRQLAGVRRWASEARDSFIDDVGWIAEDAATLQGAAARLGIQPRTAARRLERYGRRDLLDRLAPGRQVHGPRAFVDARPVREWVVELQKAGWTNAALAMAAGTSETTINRIVAGQERVRERIAAPLLAITDPPATPRRALRDWLHPGPVRRSRSREE